jgi:Tol biopolymer transport system component
MSANVHVLNNNGNLYKISLTGTNKGGPLTSSASFSLVHPSVSPDGSMVAFTQITGFSDGNIMLLNLNTNKITTISEPSFAPYNDYPVFVRR